MALLLDNNDNSCESVLLSLDAHKSVPAPFLTKTYQLVDDPSTNHIVSWGNDNSTFVVWRPPEFARDLLPNYFKHNNFSSFVRQLNTYGFRKIVPDRWEFANEFFKKGEKHLLCEIHRRKTPQHHHHHPHQFLQPSFFPFHNRLSVSSPSTDSDELANWYDSPPPPPPPPLASPTAVTSSNYGATVSALSEDNDRLRRSNSMLMSELAHMKKLYNDIIYFVQNHVKPVTPSNTFPSFLLSNISSTTTPYCYSSSAKQGRAANSPTNSSVTVVEENNNSGNGNSCKTKLFGVALQSKKRVHPESYYESSNVLVMSEETNKPRLPFQNYDLGLNLMPPSTC